MCLLFIFILFSSSSLSYFSNKYNLSQLQWSTSKSEWSFPITIIYKSYDDVLLIQEQDRSNPSDGTMETNGNESIRVLVRKPWVTVIFHAFFPVPATLDIGEGDKQCCAKLKERGNSCSAWWSNMHAFVLRWHHKCLRHSCANCRQRWYIIHVILLHCTDVPTSPKAIVVITIIDLLRRDFFFYNTRYDWLLQAVLK